MQVSHISCCSLCFCRILSGLPHLETIKLLFSLCQDARQKFRSVLVEATVKLDELVKKIGKAVDESKPYWEARRLARQVSPQCMLGGLVGALELN